MSRRIAVISSVSLGLLLCVTTMGDQKSEVPAYEFIVRVNKEADGLSQ